MVVCRGRPGFVSGFAVAVRALGTVGTVLLTALALAVAVALVLWLGFATDCSACQR